MQYLDMFLHPTQYFFLIKFLKTNFPFNWSQILVLKEASNKFSHSHQRSKSQNNQTIISHCSKQAFNIYFIRWFFIKNNYIRFPTLEAFSLLIITLHT